MLCGGEGEITGGCGDRTISTDLWMVAGHLFPGESCISWRSATRWFTFLMNDLCALV